MNDFELTVPDLYLVINNDAKEWVYTFSCAHAPMQTPS